MTTRTIQESFNAVMGARLYWPVNPRLARYGRGMCHALHVAAERGVISANEQRAARIAVRLYLRTLGAGRTEDAESMYLVEILKGARLDASPSAQLAIYKDWANRPTTGHTTGA